MTTGAGRGRACPQLQREHVFAVDQPIAHESLICGYASKPERAQHRIVKGAGTRQVAHAEGQVMQHVRRLS